MFGVFKYACVITTLFCVVHCQNETLNVSVYYESLCPDSILFIVKELYPGYQKLGNLTDIQFIPYGFSHATKCNGHWQFRCQHGPKECFGNKIQACSLAQDVGPSKHVEFINCVMSNSNPACPMKAQKCADKLGLQWKAIDDCLTNGQGDELLVHYGNLTASVTPKIQFVPTVIFNDVFNQTLQNEAVFNFLATACKLFKITPKQCAQEMEIQENVIQVV